VPTSKPAPASIDGTQLVPMYTDSRQKKNDPHNAIVSRRNSGVTSSRAETRAIGFSPASANRAASDTGWPRRRSSARSCGHRSGCRARKRGDSGSTFNSSAAIASGRMPPTRNSPRQPKRGSTCAPTRPASDPPSGMQTIVSVTANGRWRFGTYSNESAAAFGIAPPRPKPAKNRRTVSTARPPDKHGPFATRAEAEANMLADGAADHHPDHAGGLHRHERRPRQVPLAHQRRQRRAEQLVVETVENDRRRRCSDEELLIAAPVRFVERGADVDRLHADQRFRPNNGWPKSSVRRIRY